MPTSTDAVELGFDSLLELEGTFLSQGRQRGIQTGFQQAKFQAEQDGEAQGKAFGRELGMYAGIVSVLKGIAESENNVLSERAVSSVDRVLKALGSASSAARSDPNSALQKVQLVRAKLQALLSACRLPRDQLLLRREQFSGLEDNASSDCSKVTF